LPPGSAGAVFWEVAVGFIIDANGKIHEFDKAAEEGDVEIRVNLKPWLWLVYAVGFICGALVGAGLVKNFGWFC